MPEKSVLDRILEEAIKAGQEAAAKKAADDEKANVGLLAQPVKVSWTQAICDDCYFIRYPTRPDPTRISQPDREQCCDCGMPTTDGIYIREDPMTVRYPRVVKPEREAAVQTREAEPFA